jgi:hypothetical protein
LALGLTDRISNTAMIVIAVPVKYSALMFFAQSTTPLSASQLATNRTLPVRRTDPISPNTMIFRIIKVITLPFQKVIFVNIQGSAIPEKRKDFLQKNLLGDVSGEPARTYMSKKIFTGCILLRQRCLRKEVATYEKARQEQMV